jgi:hypothetical protein
MTFVSLLRDALTSNGKRLLVAVVVVALAGVMAAVARGYWDDWSGWCDQHETCGIEFTVGYGDYVSRLSRQYCGTKLENRDYGGSWHIYSVPGGCSTSDTGEVGFDSNDYGLSMCYNIDGPTMWVNCEIHDV